MKMLKLYVWHDVLTDWTSGVAFALAYSPEEAKELIGLNDYHWNGLLLDGQNYEVYESPTGHFIYGGG